MDEKTTPEPRRKVITPSKAKAFGKRRLIQEKLESSKRRQKLDAENKKWEAEQRAKAAEADADKKAEAKEKANTNPDEVQVQYLGTKDGEAYTARRHAEALAERLELPDSAILETSDGFVVGVPRVLIPEGHEWVDAPEFLDPDVEE